MILHKCCHVLMTHLEGPGNSHVTCVVGISQTQAGEMDVLQGILCQAASPAQPTVDQLGYDKAVIWAVVTWFGNYLDITQHAVTPFTY